MNKPYKVVFSLHFESKYSNRTVSSIFHIQVNVTVLDKINSFHLSLLNYVLPHSVKQSNT